MLHIQLLEWSKKPIMTSSNYKSTNSQKVKNTNYDNPSSHRHKSTYQSTFTRIQVSCSFLTHDALTNLTHGVPSHMWLGIVYGSTSFHRLRGLSQGMLERQVLRWSPLPVVPGVSRSVLVYGRTEGYCQSQCQSSSGCIDQVLSQLL